MSCIVALCETPIHSNDRCWDHRNTREDGTKTCPGPGTDGGECGRPIRSNGLCDAHAKQLRRGYELKPVGASRIPQPCTVDGCDRTKYAKSYCRGHYEQFKKGQPFTRLKAPALKCGFPDCRKDARSRGLCSGHWQQQDRGVPLTPLRTGGGPVTTVTVKPTVRVRKRKPRPVVKVERPPLPPWNPNELANVDMRPPKTGGTGGPVSIGRIEPTPEQLVRRLQTLYAANGREDLLDILGILPGNEQIPITPTLESAAA